MNSTKVLLTGATGFLGSHLAEGLLNSGCEVVATCRTNSDFWRCNSFKDRIVWLDTNATDWVEKAIDLQPTVIIHAAWSGVVAGDRMDWQRQIANTTFIASLLSIVESANSTVFIGLGSQAEYGFFDGKIAENHPANPVTGYGVAKLMAYELVRGFFNSHPNLTTKWYWLRVFTCIGKHEDANWLVPSVIQKLKTTDEIALTAGEQRAAYLFVDDFVKMIQALINSTAASGTYNISSNQTYSVKELILKLKKIVGSSSHLNFGDLPYRPNQPMHMEGDMTKFTATIGSIVESNFDEALQAVVDSYN